MGFWDKLKGWFGGTPAPTAPSAPPSPESEPQPDAVAARPLAAKARPRPPQDPYTSEILGLSADELRRRALKINPFRTAWIGRVDTIPPQSDERTALIDRGLILRGLLSSQQIDEIHRVGDAWLRHSEAVKLARAAGQRAAEQAIAERRAERVAAKEQKRREALERREARRREVALRKAEDIVFAGRDVSRKLHDRRSNVEALERAGLPVLSTPGDVARALGVTVPQLRWLSFHHEGPERTHYVYFEIPKRSGGKRLLAAPHRYLGIAQRWVLDSILSKVSVTEPAHGFVPGRSTVSNAAEHRGRHVVANLDLKDFFPSITFPRVRGLFESLGYSPAAATLLALICTEAPRTAVELDGRKFWVACGERALPQGACTSPTLSNLVARKLDRRLAGASSKLGFAYTRYADDLTFSAKAPSANVALLLSRVRAVVRDEGFEVNEKKGRVQRRGGRQEVTGVVVNDKLAVPRSEIRRLRALLHNAKKTGLAAQNREGRQHFEAWLRGKIGYVMMIDPVKGQALAEALDALG